MLASSALLALSLAACNDAKDESTKETAPANTTATEETSEKTNTNDKATQSITYLGENYELPAQVNNIITASVESMEDALILGIKPVGVLSLATTTDYLKDVTDGASEVGDKFSPNPEAILKLEPDVIMGSSKFDDKVLNTLGKVQTVIPYSHISSNWEENLLTFAKIAGKEDTAKDIIANYKKDADEAKAEFQEKVGDKTILMIRYRNGLCIYPEDVYFNPVIYNDLGAKVPDIIKNTKTQEEISLEILSEVNPDIIFLQMQTAEDGDIDAALKKLQADPVFQNTTAAKNGEVFINTMDPLAEGGTAWSKVTFLNVLKDKLLHD